MTERTMFLQLQETGRHRSIDTVVLSVIRLLLMELRLSTGQYRLLSRYCEDLSKAVALYRPVY